MLLPSGNPFKCHEEVLYFQLLIPPKRFDIFFPQTGGCSEGLGAFRFFFKDYKRIWFPDSFAPAIQNCKRISHAAQLLLHLANNTSKTQIHNYLCQECGGYRQGYGQIEVHSFYSREERARWRQGPRCLRCLKLRMVDGLGGLMMTPRWSSGCGACIPELTTRRHRGRSQAPWTVVMLRQPS